ncbi:MAG: 6-phosphofructokinase [Bacteroidetes bacterium 47-18]|nr:MAG: 6-phosphofructokinase [Bacteroidetes bacterium 47-18]
MKKIAVLTSGGDASGMNAAIRAVVRTGLYHGLEVFGIRRGYQGLIEGDIFRMATTDVSNIIQRGGTILKTARSQEFTTPEGRSKACKHLQEHGIEGLVVIGGDGSFKGARELAGECPHLRVIGIPGTIDKDIVGTDYTIGFDTAVNAAVENIDRIRDTAESHDRLFIIEVMGRDAGYIALNSGIACGAEDIFVPEEHTSISDLIKNLRYDKKRKKLVRIIVVAEGDEYGGAEKFRELIRNRFPGWEVRTAILGHLQRGGSPTYFDRVQASRMGYAAVNRLLEGGNSEMIGLQHGNIVHIGFDQACKKNKPMDLGQLEMAMVLSS